MPTSVGQTTPSPSFKGTLVGAPTSHPPRPKTPPSPATRNALASLSSSVALRRKVSSDISPYPKSPKARSRTPLPSRLRPISLKQLRLVSQLRLSTSRLQPCCFLRRRNGPRPHPRRDRYRGPSPPRHPRSFLWSSPRACKR